MLIQNKKIAIIGGGPGGLTLAKLLQLKGVNVKVYERDKNKNARVQGGSLDLHTDSGLKALESADLMGAFNANYRIGADKMRIVNKDARIFWDDHTQKQTQTFGDLHFRPEIDRGPLRKILLESLEEGTVIWDSHFQTVEKFELGWQLFFKNGEAVYTDIVIGADGANSKIRPLITPIKPFYTGITAIEGTIYDSKNACPKIHELLKGGKIFAMGDEKLLIVSSKNNGDMSLYPSFRAEESWMRDCGIDFKNNFEILAWFKQEFASWDSIWQELFENEQDYFMPRQICSMPINQTWESQPNITLIGDAAHLMTPYAGEGVNMAMLDALELSNCLTNHLFDDTKSAINHYENQMRRRTSEIIKISLFQMESLHSDNALKNMLEMFV